MKLLPSIGYFLATLSVAVSKTPACTSDDPNPPWYIICDNPNYDDPNGVGRFCEGLVQLEEAGGICEDSPVAEEDEIFCALKEKLGNLQDFAGGDDYTLFVPNNDAMKIFDTEEQELTPELFIAIIFANHFIRGKKVVPTDLFCDSYVDEMVLFQGTSSPVSTGKAPKINCVDDILGNTNGFIVGPGNKKKLNNLPRLSQGVEGLGSTFCNAFVYIVDHVIVPKYLKGKIKMIDSD